MFRRFREKIERALERREAERALSRDDIDRILHGMRDELIELRARIPKLEKETERLAARAQRQIQGAELAHGKAKEAERAGRAEEAHTAMETARRALHEAEDLRTRTADMQGELGQLKAEYAEKLDQFKDAERNRSALIARSRRVGTSRRLDELVRGPGSGLKRFERAEEDIETAEDMVEAAREVDEALGERPALREFETDLELRKLEAAREADEIEERLSELKRQLEEDAS